MSLTPFRYPGSKNKILSNISPYIDKFLIGKKSFCDAFVGGGSVLLDVARRYSTIELFINDKDYWLFCFWNIVSINDKYKLDALLHLIEQRPTIDLFYNLRTEKTMDEVRCAYKAIFFNRTTFSGIFKSGPIGGKEQKSKYTVDCRYNISKIKNKIIECNKLLRNRTFVENKDFLNYVILKNEDVPVYLDPPYVRAGKMLYSEFMSAEEHVQLSKMLLSRKNWVLSYDNDPLIRDLYSTCHISDIASRYCITGVKENWSRKSEIIITP